VVHRWGEHSSSAPDAESAAYSLWATGRGMAMLKLTANEPQGERAIRCAVAIDALMCAG
jgi:hypothetical protein